MNHSHSCECGLDGFRKLFKASEEGRGGEVEGRRNVRSRAMVGVT